MVRPLPPLPPPATATFGAAEPWRVRLGAAFQDLVPESLDRKPYPRGTLDGVLLGPVGVFTVSGTPRSCGGPPVRCGGPRET
jgi:hypothetical protein